MGIKFHRYKDGLFIQCRVWGIDKSIKLISPVIVIVYFEMRGVTPYDCPITLVEGCPVSYVHFIYYKIIYLRIF